VELPAGPDQDVWPGRRVQLHCRPHPGPGAGQPDTGHPKQAGAGEARHRGWQDRGADGQEGGARLRHRDCSQLTTIAIAAHHRRRARGAHQDEGADHTGRRSSREAGRRQATRTRPDGWRLIVHSPALTHPPSSSLLFHPPIRPQVLFDSYLKPQI